MSYTNNTELADLGRERFDQDTAAIGDRDAACHAGSTLPIRQGRAPQGLENQVFAWNTFKYTTEDKNEKEELKGALHDGQLHRANRAARGETAGPSSVTDMMAGLSIGSRGGGSGRGGRAGMAGTAAGERAGGRNAAGAANGGLEEVLIAARRTDFTPGRLGLMRAIPPELPAELFWQGPID